MEWWCRVCHDIFCSHVDWSCEFNLCWASEECSSCSCYDEPERSYHPAGAFWWWRVCVRPHCQTGNHINMNVEEHQACKMRFWNWPLAQNKRLQQDCHGIKLLVFVLNSDLSVAGYSHWISNSFCSTLPLCGMMVMQLSWRSRSVACK